MNPFELTKDPDGGGITVRVKHDFVVLTREEEKQITERITEILTENAKLWELVRILAYCMSDERDCDRCTLNGADMPTPIISACDSLPDRLREFGIEVES